MANEKVHLRDLNLLEHEELIKKNGFPSFRSKQLFQWVHQKGATNWGEMNNLPLNLRQELSSTHTIAGLSVIRREKSQLDGTEKYLLGLNDGETIETVLMNYSDRRTVCVSTQVGCPLKCAFCATGKSGFKRNLKVHEILEQVLIINKNLLSEGKSPVTNVVFMGMGEPLENYDALVKSLHILNHPEALNISFRRISVSTSGIVPGIYSLAKEKMPLVLAISLHAPNDELRSSLMPINRRYPLADLIEACHYWMEQTGRRITFEYTLFDGVNDSLKEAEEMAKLLEGLLANVNLIPFNPVMGANFQKPSMNRIHKFQKYLSEKNIVATIREEKGGDIAGACGQLRRQEMGSKGDNQI